MKILFTSLDLHALNLSLEPIEFEFAPIKGDYVQIDQFVNNEERAIITNHLESLKKVISGEVNSRVWTKKNEEKILMIGLHFYEYTEEINEENEILIF